MAPSQADEADRHHSRHGLHDCGCCWFRQQLFGRRRHPLFAVHEDHNQHILGQSRSGRHFGLHIRSSHNPARQHLYRLVVWNCIH